MDKPSTEWKTFHEFDVVYRTLASIARIYFGFIDLDPKQCVYLPGLTDSRYIVTACPVSDSTHDGYCVHFYRTLPPTSIRGHAYVSIHTIAKDPEAIILAASSLISWFSDAVGDPNSLLLKDV